MRASDSACQALERAGKEAPEGSVSLWPLGGGRSLLGAENSNTMKGGQKDTCDQEVTAAPAQLRGLFGGVPDETDLVTRPEIFYTSQR